MWACEYLGLTSMGADQWSGLEAWMRQDAAESLALDELVQQGIIEYIDFPEALKGKYQSFTQADIGKLRDAGYSAHLQAFADYEDAMASNGYVFNEFSEEIPGVGELRRVEALARYLAATSILPQPYYPHPVAKSNSPAGLAIFEQQKVIITWEGYTAFLAKIGRAHV
mgnify:CR=1 FL=1